MDEKPTYDELVERVKRLETQLIEKQDGALIQELKDSESRFKALSNAAHEGIFLHDNGVCIDVNEAGCRMFGYQHDELMGQYVSKLFWGVSRQVVESNIRNAVIHSYEVFGLRKNGTTFEVEITGKNCIFKGKEVRVAALRDVSMQKAAEQALRDSETKFREVFENAGDGILIGDLNGIMIEANKAFLKITGYTRDEIIGHHIKKIFALESLSSKPLRFDLINNDHVIIVERDILGKDGHLIPVEMNSKRPHASYYLSIIRDLRERQKAAKDLERKNRELQQAKDKAEESDRLKTSFLANMSHEIRTPMNSILGFAELIRADVCSEQNRKEYLDVIISSGHQLLDIINDVLEISRIETGQVKMVMSNLKINSIIKDLLLFFQPLTRQNHNLLEISLPDNTDQLTIVGDELKVRQILTNLISNALKFTINGNVVVGYVIRPGYLEFFVRDDGIGIPSVSLDKVFDRFLQVEYTNQIKQRGAGLGLAICKRLVEIMNGEIWVESKEGEGSTFHFTIPNLDEPKTKSPLSHPS